MYLSIPAANRLPGGQNGGDPPPFFFDRRHRGAALSVRVSEAI